MPIISSDRVPPRVQNTGNQACTIEHYTMQPNALQLRLFGPFAATVHGEPLPRLRSRKCQWLLALLALRQGRDVSRAWLAASLWPESEQSQAYYNLRQSLSSVRAALGKEARRLRSTTPLTLMLDTVDVWVDVVEFDRLIAMGSPVALEQAIGLYRGPLLEGCTEDWLAGDRSEREGQCLRALSVLADQAAASGATEAAIRLCRQTIALDPFCESAHRGLMLALSASGNHAAAAQVYRDLRLLFHRELNSRPTAETDGIAAQIHERLKGSMRTISPIGRAMAPAAGHLPIPLTNLIGRQRDLEELKRCVDTHRLVTVTGPGGIGKTRLALAVGDTAAGVYELGVRFIELAAVTDPQRVAPLVAQTLAIGPEGDRPILDTIADALDGRSVLFIIDNAEHLLPACAALAERLLTRCPQVHLLFTSRQSIGLIGESVYPVTSLAVPLTTTIRSDEDVELIRSYGAIALLIERVCEWNPGFRLTQRNGAVVIDICRQLDGIPLALELAAARMRTLSADELRLGLQNRFTLLTTGSRSALPRHRTLKSLIDWSYELLTPPEQSLLQHLAVFTGGWTLASAQEVCAPVMAVRSELSANQGGPEESTAQTIMDLLSSLVDKSLIVVDTMGSHARYRMLETVRQYAAAKLTASGNEAHARKRHSDYFFALAGSLNVGRMNVGGITRQERQVTQADWLTLLESEYANLDAAIRWCRQNPDDAAIARQITVALYRFWHMRGYLREGRDHLLYEARAAGQRGEHNVEATLLFREAALGRLQGDVAGARASLTRSHQLSCAGGDALTEARSLVLLGSLELAEGENAAAVAWLEHARIVAIQGGFRAVHSEALVWLGDAARARNDFVTAREYYDQGLAVANKIDDGWFAANALAMMAELALTEGNTPEAHRLADRAMQGYLNVGDRTYCVLTLDTLAGIALAENDPERAGTLVAIVDHLIDELNIQMAGAEKSAHAARVHAARSLLSGATLATLAGVAGRMNWAEILKFARNND